MLYWLFDRLTLPWCGSGVGGSLVRHLAYQRKRVLRRQVEARLQAAGQYDDEVLRGPFAGVHYLPRERYASCRFEKIVGAYEHELHPLLKEISASKQYRTVINVGAAEGYYTVGLARMFPIARVISYEMTEDGQEFCAELARLNEVSDRVEVLGACTPEILGKLSVVSPVLLVMDTDLGERTLLDPQVVPWLREVDILVELHECLQSGTNELIRSRFEKSHHIRQVVNAGLEYARYPELTNLTFEEIYAMVGEDRAGLQEWYFMEPKK
ncbi:MAG TPA: hypothetical protein VLE43_20655 [Candidatus Saccharimonadia bacterium]|nr:hypothetical protein [Candidatus Saccharimonadia bacterium]